MASLRRSQAAVQVYGAFTWRSLHQLSTHKCALIPSVVSTRWKSKLYLNWMRQKWNSWTVVHLSIPKRFETFYLSGLCRPSWQHKTSDKKAKMETLKTIWDDPSCFKFYLIRLISIIVEICQQRCIGCHLPTQTLKKACRKKKQPQSCKLSFGYFHLVNISSPFPLKDGLRNHNLSVTWDKWTNNS